LAYRKLPSYEHSSFNESEASTPIANVAPYGGTISSVEFSVSLLQDDWILTELLLNERAEAIVTGDYSASELAVMLGE
jgi:hypothetical protein